jgi:4-amino-4-deoxy-L-arabinose transferase-like glycosyltransferase
MPIFKQILKPQPAGPSHTDVARAGWLAHRRVRFISGSLAASRGLPEIVLLVAVSSLLNFWDLSRNGWANDYYAAAVRSMARSWHNFLFASLDPAGIQTIDKPPLAFWIQTLSVRVFGFHPLSILIPDAVIGVAAVVLLYDLVRRVFGRVGGLVAGLALATTPITVAMSRHNNPDALLVLCCVAALWCFVRALQDGRTRWIVLTGAVVGLGFETKMGLALVVVPGIVVAWLAVRPSGWKRVFDQLASGGIAMLLVGGAWPLLVALTPADDRPWISGTSDNSIVSLIFGYNGFGRVAGQNGGPSAATTSGIFAQKPGVFRLLNFSLGGQAGWLVGFALAGTVAILVSTRLRRSDPRTAWTIAVGLSFIVTAVILSVSSGIIHPYYVSLLAPFTAALVGASAGQLLSADKLVSRILAGAVVAAGVACELVVLGDYPGQLTWVAPLLLASGGLACVLLLALGDVRARALALALAVGGLLVAPSVWAIDTVGYATNSTFPAGGPAKDNSALLSVSRAFLAAGPAGGRQLGFTAGAPGAGPPAGAPSARSGVSSLFSQPQSGAGPPNLNNNGDPSLGSQPNTFTGGFGGTHAPKVRDPSLRTVIAFVRTHGGGTLAVSSQSNAANAILAQNARVAGLGGWSGRESEPTVGWLAQEVLDGRIRWVYNQGRGNFGAPDDNRAGSTPVLNAAAQACQRVVTSRGAGPLTVPAFRHGVAHRGLYDCQGDGTALESLAGLSAPAPS